MSHRFGNYEVIKPLSSGGMATLYLGKRSGPAGFERRVAIKVVQSKFAKDPQFISMFLDEARIAARISHPNVVRIEELGESENGDYYLVMEHIFGLALSEFLMELHAIDLRLTPAAAVAIVCAAAAGLHAAHGTRDDAGALLNVVHRDVSPQNILVGAMGETKIIDFGIVAAREKLHVTAQDDSIRGKLAYMSPEQLSGAVDHRTDIFALGIVTWEMLAMKRFYEGLSGMQLIEAARDGRPYPPLPSYVDAPIALEQVLQKATAFHADERYASAREFRQALREAVPSSVEFESSDLSALLMGTCSRRLAKLSSELQQLRPLNTQEMSHLPAQALIRWTVAATAFDDDLPTIAQAPPFAPAPITPPALAQTALPTSGAKADHARDRPSWPQTREQAAHAPLVVPPTQPSIRQPLSARSMPSSPLAPPSPLATRRASEPATFAPPPLAEPQSAPRKSFASPAPRTSSPHAPALGGSDRASAPPRPSPAPQDPRASFAPPPSSAQLPQSPQQAPAQQSPAQRPSALALIAIGVIVFAAILCAAYLITRSLRG